MNYIGVSGKTVSVVEDFPFTITAPTKDNRSFGSSLIKLLKKWGTDSTYNILYGCPRGKQKPKPYQCSKTTSDEGNTLNL